MNECSELFEEVFDSALRWSLRTCACGRTHFDGYNQVDWEHGELEALREKANTDPKIYVEHQEAIGTLEIRRAANRVALWVRFGLEV